MADTTQVEPADASRRTSDILGPSSDEATVQMSELDQKCYWNDVEYEQGARVSTGGKSYVCSYGRWVPVD